MRAALGWIIRRDLVLAVRQRTDVMTTVVFFVIVVSLFPLGVGPEMEKLRPLAAGVLWVAALLASMLSLSRLFAADHADGSLEQLLIAPQPLALLVLGKILAHWLACGLPLVLIAPVLGIQYDLSGAPLLVMTLSLLIGTPILSAIGAVGAALTLGLRGGGVLIALLVLPLYVPVIIFGAGAVEATQTGIGAEGHLSLLAAFLMLSLVVGPLAAATALRISVE
jgi:heme exporter protein B